MAPPRASVIPDGSTNRRGYWGDMPLDSTNDTATVTTGSLLWLYENALQTQDNRVGDPGGGGANALAWMVTTGIAGSVNATAAYPALGRCDLQIDIEQQGRDQRLCRLPISGANS